MKKNIKKLFYPTSLLLLIFLGCSEENESKYALYNGIQGNWLRSSDCFQYNNCIFVEKQTIEFTADGEVIKRDINEYNCLSNKGDEYTIEDMFNYKIDMEDNYIFIRDDLGDLYTCKVNKLTNNVMELSITERGNISSRSEEWRKIK